MINSCNHMDKKVVIVVLNYKNYSDTIECLKSLNDITYPKYDIVVVDNKSENNSLSYIGKYLLKSDKEYVLIEDSDIGGAGIINERIILLQSSKNGGYAAGNNLGIRIGLEKKADYILILNNDTVVDSGFLAPLVKYADEHKDVGAIGPKVLDENGNIDHTCARRRMTLVDYIFQHSIVARLLPENRWIKRHTYKGEYDFANPKKVDVLSGSCILFKSDFICAEGLLDENTFLYLEEFIIHEKLKRAGYISVINPESLIVHKHGRSTSTRSSEIIDRYRMESRRYYLINYRNYNKCAVDGIIAYTYWFPKFFRSIMRKGGL
jgi:GT2 family glycosyltransferase